MSEPDSDSERAYLAAMRILQYRFNSEAELRRKLKGKGFAADVVDATIERLRGEKWLDDDRFAGAFVRTRQRRRVGPLRIARELAAAGVGKEASAVALRENADPDRDRADALALAEKRLRILLRRHGRPAEEVRNKLTGWLLNHGYDAALVRDVVAVILSRAGGEDSPIEGES
jgi:regulatory protein